MMLIRLWLFVACLVAAKFLTQIHFAPKRPAKVAAIDELSAEQRMILAAEMEKAATCMRSNLSSAHCRERLENACLEMHLKNCGLGSALKTSQIESAF